MEKVDFIWMDGEFIPWDEAKIHVLTHSLHYGGAVFEGLRFYEAENGKAAIFRLEDHINRLFKSAAAIEMKSDFTEKDIVEAIIEIVRRNKIKDGYIRPIMYFGYGVMGLYPGKSKVETSIAVWGWTNYLGAESIKVKTSSIMRIHPKTADTKVKITGYYINSIMASLEVRSLGYNEALLLDYEGNVAEGPGENIFMVKDGRLITPKEDNILPGLTRDSIFRIAKDNNIEVVEKALSLEELKDADEAFLTGTAVEVAPIKQIDETNIGNGKIGPITQKLKSIYTDAIHGKIETYNDWLTYV